MRKGFLIAGLIAGALTLAACSGSSTPTPGPATTPAARTTTVTVPAPSRSTTTAPSSSPSASSGPSTAPSGPGGGPVPSGFLPLSGSFVSADDGWVLGSTSRCAASPCTSIVRTRDGGASWQGIPAPRALAALDQRNTTNAVQAIRFADQNDGWVFGRQLWSTHDGGATWTRLSSPVGTGQYVSSLETGGGSVYLAVVACQANGVCGATATVYVASTGSDTFTRLATISLPPGNTAGDGTKPAALTVYGSDWWLPAKNGIEHGSGRTSPTLLTSACKTGTSTHLAAADATHLDALCVSGGAEGSAVAQLRGSTDGGRSWTDAGGQHNVMSGVDDVADNGRGTLIVADNSGGTGIARTTDDGRTLTPVKISTPSGGLPWSDAGFTTATQGFAVVYGREMFSTSDAGVTWKPVTF